MFPFGHVLQWYKLKYVTNCHVLFPLQTIFLLVGTIEEGNHGCSARVERNFKAKMVFMTIYSTLTHDFPPSIFHLLRDKHASILSFSRYLLICSHNLDLIFCCYLIPSHLSSFHSHWLSL